MKYKHELFILIFRDSKIICIHFNSKSVLLHCSAYNKFNTNDNINLTWPINKYKIMFVIYCYN